MRRIYIGSWLMIVMALLGCASAPLQQREAQRLDRLPVGTFVEVFRKVFPEAYIGGQSGTVTAYVYRDSRYSPFNRSADGWSGRVTDFLHFYFREDKLVQWGSPGDWEHDFKITIRHQ